MSSNFLFFLLYVPYSVELNNTMQVEHYNMIEALDYSVKW